METASNQSVNFKQVGNVGMLCGVVGLAASIGALASSAERFWQSYIFAFIFFASLVLGMLGLTLLHHTVRGSWGLSVLRLWESGGGPVAIGALAVMFVPIVVGMPTIYHHWYHPDPNDHVLAYKASWWLNPTFFIIRSVIYFACWFALAYFMRRSSVRQDKTLDPAETAYRTNRAAPGIVLFFVTVTLAITDWLMSLDPHWFSQIMGFWYVVGGALGSLALTTFIVCYNAKQQPYREIVTPQLTKDLGNMLFTFTLLWAYMTLSQFIIMWSGNLPEFIRFYTQRDIGTQAAYNILGGLNVVLQFFVPFLVLLAPRTKAKPELLIKIVVLIFLMRISDVWWYVMPMFQKSMAPGWTDAAAFLTVGGFWLAVFANQTTKASLIPEHDNRLLEAAHSHA